MSHLFHGVHEQNYVAHVMAYAAKMGMYKNRPDLPGENSGVGANSIPFPLTTILSIILTTNFLFRYVIF